MGYQESMLFCSNKKNFNKLCKNLNASKAELDDFVSVYAIGKTKSSLTLFNPWSPNEEFGSIPENSYFVWWGGERHPFQSGCGLLDEEKEVFNVNSPYWYCVFCEYIKQMDELLRDMTVENANGFLRENNNIRLLELPEGDSIKDEYVHQLE